VFGLGVTERRRRIDTGEWFADLRKRSVCVYLCGFKNKLHYAESRKVEDVKRGTIKR
jgi:hypothetical protein